MRIPGCCWHGRDRDSLLAGLQRKAPPSPAAHELPPWWPLGLRVRPQARLTPPDPPERALQRLGPLELPGLAPAELERRLAMLYGQLQAGDSNDGSG